MKTSTTIKQPSSPSFFYFLNSSSLPRPYFLLELAKDYGGIVKIPPKRRSFLVSDPNDLEKILVTDVDHYGKAGYTLDNVRKMLGKAILTETETDEWWEKRKNFATYFQPKQLLKWTSLIQQHVNETIQNWRTNGFTNQFFDLSHATMKLLLITASDLLYGYPLNENYAGKLVVAIAKENYLICQLSALFPKIPTPGNLALKKTNAFVQEFAKTLAEYGLKHPKENLMQLILKNYANPDANSPFLLDEIKTFLLTGHETTGAALNWTWFCLYKNPEVYQNLITEIRTTVFDPEKDPLQQFPYATAVFKESLRLYPPIWITGRICKEDSILGEYHLKKGSELIISPFVTQRLEQFWTDAETFNPERFLQDTPTKHRLSFLPFGAGKRVCIASQLALHMGIIVLISILKEVDITVDPKQSETIEHNITLKLKHPLQAMISDIKN